MEYWIWLTELKGIGPITQKKLLDYFKTPARIYAAAEEELRSVPGIGSSLGSQFVKPIHWMGLFQLWMS
ncbi:helix-hairpin-helix domain-containing protein [Acetobacterium carbinolicum]|uniref:helix-hairpin-helix domain-containing protein n=1 Tax=Acetobacterium carbinolicum TaxID=52690 RepID=UPI0039C8E7A1